MNNVKIAKIRYNLVRIILKYPSIDCLQDLFCLDRLSLKLHFRICLLLGLFVVHSSTCDLKLCLSLAYINVFYFSRNFHYYSSLFFSLSLSTFHLLLFVYVCMTIKCRFWPIKLELLVCNFSTQPLLLTSPCIIVTIGPYLNQ